MLEPNTFSGFDGVEEAVTAEFGSICDCSTPDDNTLNIELVNVLDVYVACDGDHAEGGRFGFELRHNQLDNEVTIWTQSNSLVLTISEPDTISVTRKVFALIRTTYASARHIARALVRANTELHSGFQKLGVSDTYFLDTISLVPASPMGGPYFNARLAAKWRHRG